MIKSSKYILFCFILLPFLSLSQELSYTHYDTKDGLAGSTVYCATLDKDGFLWFGTETGLSRFDGTHFKNFTTRDGLPDNEIIKLFTDSKGRVWMAPFQNKICYYYHGKIYTQENDSLLAKLKLSVNALHFAENSEGDILMNEFDGKKIHLIKKNGTVTSFETINAVPFIKITAIAPTFNNAFLILDKNKVYEIKNDTFSLLNVLPPFPWASTFKESLLTTEMVAIRDFEKIRISDLNLKKVTEIAFPRNCINLSLMSDSLVCFGLHSGITIYNYKSGVEKTYMLGKPVSNVIKDQEGNWWFTTLGQGIFHLNSDFVSNISLPSIDNAKINPTSFSRPKKEILLGSELSYFYTIKNLNGHISLKKRQSLHKVQYSKVIKIDILKNNDTLFYESAGIAKTVPEPRLHDTAMIISIKSVAKIDNEKFLLGTSSNAVTFNPYTFKIIDTIWNRRAACVFYKNDTFYIGALDGLYLKKDQTVQYWGDSISSFKNRILDIKESEDGTLWFATNGDGILGYKNQKIIAHFTAENGLASNICRTLFTYSHYLWIGTDRGLNKIDISSPYHSVTTYSTADGLASNIINGVMVDSSNVYIGTPEGLTYFDEKKLKLNSRCDLRITGITIAGQSYPTDTTHVSIPHQKNNLQFEFVGISYRSAGDITYRYRLIGLDSNWQTTRETFLNYPTLPSGNYELQLQAINKFGVASNTVSIPFDIEKLFWEKTWFKFLVASAIAILVWLLLNLRIRFIRRQEREKQKIANRITELEQLALKSQMNPHFIFNSLNSIQQYVIDKDIAGANKFISGFSKLMRQTMYFSSKPYISVSDELNYLSTYLELEKDRLENVFIYTIIVEENIYTQNYLIPPMILQPYIENSVRHGVRYRKDKAGVILINVSRQENYLIFIIEDNGIGRKKSQQLKGNTSIEYQSKGMSLTGDRIKMLNEKSGSKIEVLIDDMEDTDGHALGTKVIVRFPVIEN